MGRKCDALEAKLAEMRAAVQRVAGGESAAAAPTGAGAGAGGQVRIASF